MACEWPAPPARHPPTQHARHQRYGVVAVGDAPGVGHQAVKLRRWRGRRELRECLYTAGRHGQAWFLLPVPCPPQACPVCNSSSIRRNSSSIRRNSSSPCPARKRHPPLRQTPGCPREGCRSCSAPGWACGRASGDGVTLEAARSGPRLDTRGLLRACCHDAPRTPSPRTTSTARTCTREHWPLQGPLYWHGWHAGSMRASLFPLPAHLCAAVRQVRRPQS